MNIPSISTSPCPECCRFGEHYHLCPRLAEKQALDAKFAKEHEAAAKRGVEAGEREHASILAKQSVRQAEDAARWERLCAARPNRAFEDI